MVWNWIGVLFIKEDWYYSYLASWLANRRISLSLRKILLFYRREKQFWKSFSRSTSKSLFKCWSQDSWYQCWGCTISMGILNWYSWRNWNWRSSMVSQIHIREIRRGIWYRYKLWSKTNFGRLEWIRCSYKLFRC